MEKMPEKEHNEAISKAITELDRAAREKRPFVLIVDSINDKGTESCILTGAGSLFNLHCFKNALEDSLGRGTESDKLLEVMEQLLGFKDKLRETERKANENSQSKECNCSKCRD